MILIINCSIYNLLAIWLITTSKEVHKQNNCFPQNSQFQLAQNKIGHVFLLETWIEPVYQIKNLTELYTEIICVANLLTYVQLSLERRKDNATSGQKKYSRNSHFSLEKQHVSLLIQQFVTNVLRNISNHIT